MLVVSCPQLRMDLTFRHFFMRQKVPTMLCFSLMSRHTVVGNWSQSVGTLDLEMHTCMSHHVTFYFKDANNNVCVAVWPSTFSFVVHSGIWIFGTYIIHIPDIRNM